jgi:hypothetical protein
MSANRGDREAAIEQALARLAVLPLKPQAARD